MKSFLASRLLILSCMFWVNVPSGQAAPETDFLTVAVSADSPPFCFIDLTHGAEPSGFEIDLIRAVAEHMGKKLKLRNMDYAAILPAILSKTVDVGISQIEKTPQRAQNMGFSQAYYATQTALLMRGNSLPSDGDEIVWQGKNIGVQLGSSHENYLTQEIAPHQPTMRVQSYNMLGEMVQDLKNGRVHGVLLDEFYARQLLQRDGFLIKVVPGTKHPYAIAFCHGSSLETELNKALNFLKTSGVIQSLCNRWLKAAPE